MLTELCAELRNYFLVPDGIHLGTFTISGGTIELPEFLHDGQYFRIVGSTLNDGVYRYPASELTDESFAGAVWAMAVPPAVVALADEIKIYAESEAGKASPYVSESFGGYAYQRATGENGLPASWRDVFASRMRPYRRMRVL